MLEMIRKGAQTGFAKVLLALLALSFVAFLGDVRGIGGTPPVATVGGQKIMPSDLERALDNEMASISQRARRQITKTEALQFGLDTRALQGLIARAALDQKASQLGLAVSDAAAAESLVRDPSFQTVDGRFDRQGFNNFLRQIGVRERDFIELRRREEVRLQLTDSIARAIVTPYPLVEAVYNWREETRVIEFFTLDSEKTATVPDPDVAKLKEVYEASKTQFTAPEYRQLQVLLAGVEDLKGRVEIGDEAIAKAYDETKDTYATPEQRRIQQIPFKDKAAADAAKAAIMAGKNFMTVAEEMKLKDTDIDLGLVKKSALLDPKIADAAFKLERNAVSDVIEGKFTMVLLRVPEIIPGKQPTLTDVKDKVREKLQREKAREDARKLRDEVEDLRAAGKPVKEIADLKKLKLVEIPAADASNKTMDRKAAMEHPDADKLVQSGFDTRSGPDRDAVELSDGGYGWVHTAGVTPPRQKPYDEVEADVRKLHITNERNRLMRELTQKLADRITAGEAMSTVAAEHGGKVEKTPAITRTTSPQGLTEPAVKQAFALPVGRGGHTENADRTGRTVLRVAEIAPAAAPAREKLAPLMLDITQQIQADTLDAFIGALQKGAGVTVDEAQLRRVRGVTP
ncbi:MAG: SurA N-terminal domain-containing protein [Hyphomicrobiaceae bacterium]|nr:SurA N-terminal domain-containing protein [Hyphomicrobiaceae bacterium]